MSDNVKHIIDEILLDKKGLIISKLHTVQENILNELESLSKLDGFNDYTLPDNITMGQQADNTGKNDIDQIHKYTKEISSSVNQLALINNLLDGIKLYCQRTALFLLRDDKLVGWKGKGFSESDNSVSDEEIKRIFFSLSADTIFKKVLNSKESYSGKPNSQSDDHLIYSRFGGSMPKAIFVLPFFVKGKPQAVIYADTLDKPIKNKEIEILAITGEMSLDLLPLKQKILAKVKTQEFVDDPKEQTKVEIPDPIHEVTAVEDSAVFQSTKAKDPGRTARVIIHDLIMYNPGMLEKGLQQNDLYGVFKDTLDQAKEEFLRKHKDISIFEKELVKILAKGDKSLLDGYNFETM